MDPEDARPPDEPDLDAIAADLAAVETTLDELDAGTYRHDDDGSVPPTPPGSAPAEPPAS